jgi:transcriptional regulator with XRE-family HTH domain
MVANKKLYQRIGALIRLRRQEANMTQQELARRLGLTRTSVTQIESGRQKLFLHSLYDIASVLRITPHALLPPLEGVPTHLTDADALADLAPEERHWVETVLNGAGN